MVFQKNAIFISLYSEIFLFYHLFHTKFKGKYCWKRIRSHVQSSSLKNINLKQLFKKLFNVHIKSNGDGIT